MPKEIMPHILVVTGTYNPEFDVYLADYQPIFVIVTKMQDARYITGYRTNKLHGGRVLYRNSRYQLELEDGYPEAQSAEEDDLNR